MTRSPFGLASALALAACASGAGDTPPAAVPGAVDTVAAAPAVDTAAALAAIDQQGIRAHVRFLSDDLLEGRAPGTRGGRLAAEYIAAHFAAMGLDPVDGSYFQRVPILAVTADPEETRLDLSGPRGTLSARTPDDFVGWTLTQREEVEASGEVVFVGYGVRAPEYRWDDYAGVDARGKIVMMLVNDPPATPEEPELFGGRAMTYYGRWTYKLEEAERQGAAGVILVHTTESASYGWNVVTNSWSGAQYQLPLASGRASPLALASWVTEDAARRLVALGGQELDALTAAAQRRGFRAVPLGVAAEARVRSRIDHSETANVVGLLRGRTDEVVTYGAHYDHLGIGAPDATGDSIYNGALDNASGVAVILEVADGFRTLRHAPRRSVLFIAIAAEESGLLGAQHYVENPLFPLERTVANLNIDMTHLMGPTRDVEQLGGDRSTLGAELDAILEALGMSSTGDPRPEAGSFFRSDHFPFAKAGVPALYFKSGQDVVGMSPEEVTRRMEEFNARHYHQPSDEYREDFDFRGAEELARIAFRLGYRVASAEEAPRWLPTSEFQRR